MFTLQCKSEYNFDKKKVLIIFNDYLKESLAYYEMPETMKYSS